MPKSLSIGLSWHSDSSGNLGVGALTVGNIALIKRAAARADIPINLHLFRAYDPPPSYIPHDLTSRHDINGRFMLSPTGYWRAIKKLDLMLDIGAGDSFADIYPTKRLAYMLATKALCRLRGIPLVFSPQTIGPFTRQPHSMLAGLALRSAEAVFARDPISYEAIGHLAPGATRYQAIDVAFALPFTPAPAQRSDQVRVGINVSGLLYSGGYGGQNDYGLTIDYPDFTHTLIDALLQLGVEVELISHVSSHIARDDDERAAKQVQSKYPAAKIIPRFASPSDAKSYISGLDFLVAARMHASIAAWSAGVPVLPVSYSRKFEGLYGGLDYPWLIPAKGLSTQEAVEKALEAFHQRARLKADLARGQQAVESGLEAYVSYLTQLFQDLRK